ncbi:hypothetical protein [Enterococcus dongliensis]|uniref:hypothetical protein n=1 Tax=Enterococcus dongliensis TaxID=2559925 RepID=UPI00288D7E26|nr:hypothetical protein [Enterococcus dongliensis]MDT2670007.1 hypothetical protein [Enterococcus dongliensis]MDT2675062.1 hypothetical protein [Enterococcus dongliensis]
MDKTNERILLNNSELRELKKIILFSLNEGYGVYYSEIETTKKVLLKIFPEEFEKIVRNSIVE